MALFTLLAGPAAVAQDFTVSVPTEVLETIGEILPERSNAGAAFISPSFDSNIVFSASATARIIFVHEGAGYQNSLGYFTYTVNGDGSITINSADMLIENATQNSVVTAGYGYDLRDAGGAIRTFNAGERLGFFLIADGNRRASSIVSGWTYDFSDGLGTVPSSDPNVNRQRGRGLYTTVSSLNPEMLQGQPDKARHLALIEVPGVPGFLGGGDFLLCGFEDLRRTWGSDEDFNDLVFLVEASPISAISTSNLFRYEPNDPDGDGVKGVNDSFPNDADRATIERIPSTGHTVIAFEDQYPSIGDADFNDAVIAYVFELSKDANGNVKDILATFSLVARGAAYDHAFGLHIPGLPATATGTVDVQRFVSDSSNPVDLQQRTVQALIAAGTRRIEDIIGSSTVLLPPPSGQTFTNTLFDPVSANAGLTRVRITFDVAVPPTLLGAPPYDPFLFVDNPTYPNTRVDIHLAGKPSFADRPAYLPLESGSGAFLDGNGFPWAIEVPNSWRYPMETVSIESAYPDFSTWRTSLGIDNLDWYDNAITGTGLVGPELGDLIPARGWTLDIPGR
jgi:LruC domain-containing protein